MMDEILWKLLVWLLNWGFVFILVAFNIAAIFSW